MIYVGVLEAMQPADNEGMQPKKKGERRREIVKENRRESNQTKMAWIARSTSTHLH